MRRLTLALALWIAVPAVAQDARAQTAPTASAQATAPRAAAAATTLRYEVAVSIDGSKRATTKVTWEVRIDDPAACAAGLLAPAGLDGASDGDASVLEDTLLVGAGATKGTTYTLTATTVSANRGSQSGAFLSPPDLPTQSAVFTLRAPAWEPLHVWHDAHGAPDIGTRSGRSVEIRWENLPGDQPAEVVWSTWADWISAGTAIAGQVTKKLADKRDLGRELSDGYTGIHVAEAFERTAWAVELEPNGTLDWTEARNAVDVIASKSGSPVDRGVVLLSLLRLASYDADPGYFRPARTRGSFPITVPAPAMLGRPMIVVHREDGDVFIDPANDYVAVPDLPAGLIGGVTWLPGDLPSALVSDQTVDGTVIINGSVSITGDGAASWSAEISATGAAQQWIRELLGPLEEENRIEALRRLVQAGRPGLERFTATATGTEKTRARLKLSISGHDEHLLDSIGAGLTGEVPALLAPAMAAWLPPNIDVREVISISVPQAVEIVAATPPTSAFTDAALLTRHSQRNGARISLVTEVTRPYRSSTVAVDTAAQRFLEGEAQHGPYLVVHATATKETMKALRASPLDPVDRQVLEGVLWWRQRLGTRTAKAFRGAIETYAGTATAASLKRYGGDEPRLWELLAKAAEDHGTGGDRLAVALACEAIDQKALAWQITAGISADATLDPSARAEASLQQARLQPEERPAEGDPAAARWTDPTALLAQAEALVGATDPQILLYKARAALRKADWAGAEAILQQIPEANRAPVVDALHAQALAESDAASDVVIDRLNRALDAAPRDADVLAAASTIHLKLGQAREATRYALTAARLEPDVAARWDAVVPVALTSGDLPTASAAAQKANTLDPKNLDRAETLALVSAMIGDDEGWRRAKTTNPGALPSIKGFPPSLQQLMEIAPESALLALLQQHDAEVVADPVLLGIRAQMRLDAGLLDEAARDGVLLSSRHGQADGVALAFAATAGRMYSTTSTRLLAEAAKQSPAARATQMEVALLLGTSDPITDAAQMAGDPRALVVSRLRNDAKGLAAEVKDWPMDARNPTMRAPAGYRANLRLGASPGVVAFSNAESSTAILRTPVIDALPAPLFQLYTPGTQKLAELPNGGTVVALEGGPLPLFGARALVQADEPYQIWALGFSVEAAGRALAIALE